MASFGQRYSGFDRFQQRHRWLGFPLAVLQKYSDDQGAYLAATITYYGFFAIFPLLLVLTTVLGFLLPRHHGLERSVLDSALPSSRSSAPSCEPACSREALWLSAWALPPRSGRGWASSSRPRTR